MLNAFGFSKVAYADDDYIEARRLLESGQILPLEKILKLIRPVVSGKILEVEIEKKDSIIVYEIELLSEKGIVSEVYINAKSGEILSVKEDD